jgi:hypothetical protein
MFSLFGSDRSALAASEASSAMSGFSAWRASSRLRKSTGVFRSNGSPFSLSLMSAPSGLVGYFLAPQRDNVRPST